MLLDLVLSILVTSAPDRQLDLRIAQALPHHVSMPHRHDLHAWMTKISGRWVEVQRFPGGYWTSGDRYIPRFTASLDAALTLIPDGYMWKRTIGPDNKMGMLVYNPTEFGSTCYYPCEGRTDALALCAAAVRAHTALAERVGEA